MSVRLTRASLIAADKAIEDEIDDEEDAETEADDEARTEAWLALSDEEQDRIEKEAVQALAREERERQAHLTPKQRVRLHAFRVLRSCLRTRMRIVRLHELNAPKVILDKEREALRVRQVELVKNRIWRSGGPDPTDPEQ